MRNCRGCEIGLLSPQNVRNESFGCGRKSGCGSRVAKTIQCQGLVLQISMPASFSANCTEHRATCNADSSCVNTRQELVAAWMTNPPCQLFSYTKVAMHDFFRKVLMSGVSREKLGQVCPLSLSISLSRLSLHLQHDDNILNLFIISGTSYVRSSSAASMI